ncbi:hypothetical protein CES86_1515 [Brucella lupini]|uniref:Uncharacterized protein n=1 Tax=Brucella lupini TaxID=255457 RepID=A0A256GVR2_9HYPH|nr:hypothetical protein CES86_1515 [Brucella lupini]
MLGADSHRELVSSLLKRMRSGKWTARPNTDAPGILPQKAGKER